MRWLRIWKLAHALRNPSWEVRARAMKKLGERSDVAMLTHLMQGLRDPHMQVRAAAFKAIVQLGESGIGPLVATLHSADPTLQEAAAAALVQLGPPAVDPLVKLLREERGPVRHFAIRALGQMKDVRAAPALNEALSDWDFEVRKLAVIALARMWQPTVEPLIASLKDWNVDVRTAAAEALGQIGDGRAVAPLVKALADKEENVRRSARESLVRLADPATVELLLEVVDTLSRDLAPLVGDVLAAVGRKSLEPVVPVLACNNAEVRKIAVRVVAECGKKRSVEHLIPLLSDSDAGVRRTAAEALSGLGWKPDNPANRAAYAVATENWEAVTAEGAAAVEPLLPVLQEVSRASRKAAVVALGRIVDVRSLEPLMARLDDTFEDIRAAAVDALGRIGNSQTVEPIMGCLCDGSALVRAHACLALGRLADERAVEPMVKLLRDTDETVRAAATETLRSLSVYYECGARAQVSEYISTPMPSSPSTIAMSETMPRSSVPS